MVSYDILKCDTGSVVHNRSFLIASPVKTSKELPASPAIPVKTYLIWTRFVIGFLRQQWSVFMIRSLETTFL